jgi:hypothetical protein
LTQRGLEHTIYKMYLIRGEHPVHCTNDAITIKFAYNYNTRCIEYQNIKQQHTMYVEIQMQQHISQVKSQKLCHFFLLLLAEKFY